MPGAVLAIDLGTQSLRASLIGAGGEIGWQWSHPIASHVAGEVFEQDPVEWEHLLRRALAEAAATGEKPLAVAASGPLAGYAPLDTSGRPLAPAVTYADRRPAAHVDTVLAALETMPEADPLRLRCYGADPLPNALFARERTPEASLLLDATSYLGYLLAGTTSLNAITALRLYTPGLMASLGIDRRLFGPVIEAGARLGVLGGGNLAPARWSDVPVIAVPFDSKCAYLASGLERPGDAAEISGTVASLGVLSAAPVVDAERRIYSVPFASAWLVRGSTAMAGGVLEWARRQLGFADFDAFEVAVRASPPGARGVVFLPYLAGERAPLWTPHARGAFLGLTLDAQREDMARAVFEGLALGLRHIVDVMEGLGAVPRQIHVSGGLSRSRLLNQVKADVLSVPVIPLVPHELTTLGVAQVAFAALGLRVEGLARRGEAMLPRAELRALYGRQFSSYREHVEALLPTFERQGENYD